ncbi:Piwi-domain-containing protein [Cucurbitaria berberidis CBS 394.84]|uniref:Piwi-domain-containing protein n=1 Tax=Cucurbitaria berberidis CBS 394.84 TaxID=1168544 RepID=A0A9P4GQ44_9PLEO|nr:Piwi-domain-containing protein [Cucurbitaria berberidis CBS 394.84]KAF1849346.1 Piwi-domain-containing protein [Cucurbitaria berberidis CBS 394.84]
MSGQNNNQRPPGGGQQAPPLAAAVPLTTLLDAPAISFAELQRSAPTPHASTYTAGNTVAVNPGLASKLSSYEGNLKYPVRTGLRAMTNKNEVLANYFKVSIDPKTVFYEYQILNIPESESRAGRKRYMATAVQAVPFLRNNQNNFATDNIGTIISWFYVRDSFFDLRTNERNAIAPLRAMRGYSYRVKPTIGNILLNVSPANSAFWRPLLVSEVLQNGSGPFGGSLDNVKRALKNVRVYVNYARDGNDTKCKHPNCKNSNCRGAKSKDAKSQSSSMNAQHFRIKTIQGFGLACNVEKFEWEHKDVDGVVIPAHTTDVTVQQYQQAQYGRVLQFPSSPAVNIIMNFGELILDLLRDWHRLHRTFPKNVLYYRDGVSTSQYDEVIDKEVSTIQKAFAALATQLNMEQVPRFKTTAVIVTKRHSTRFFPRYEKDAMNHNSNCKPGLLVDNVITSPYFADFYLQSHNGIKGTARPCHYFVLRNEMEMTTDELQDLTHNLCHTYVRATLGVSYASPAYYADRLCERGRCYLRAWYNPDNQHRGDYDTHRKKVEELVETERKRPQRGKNQRKTVEEIKEDKEDAENVIKHMANWMRDGIQARWDQSPAQVVKDHSGGRIRFENWRRTMYWM